MYIPASLLIAIALAIPALYFLDLNDRARIADQRERWLAGERPAPTLWSRLPAPLRHTIGAILFGCLLSSPLLLLSTVH